MIVSFRHKGLEAFFRSGTQAGIQPIHAKRLREMLTALHAASSRWTTWPVHPGGCMACPAIAPAFLP
jgi:predicted naringenin-chalcone synthase